MIRLYLRSLSRDLVFMKVLIALDHAECSQFAVNSALSRPWTDQSSIKIVHVLEPYDPIDSTANAAQWSEWVEAINVERLASAQTLLANAVSTLKTSHARIDVTSELIEAALPDQAITEIAKHWSADVIVMGSHDHRGLKRLLLGSTAHSVLQQSVCTVEIIKSQWPSTPKEFHVVVALEQSVYSSSLFNTILRRPWPDNSVFKILSVVRPGDEKRMTTDVHELESDLAQKAQMLDSAMKSDSSASFEVVARENPKEVILCRIEDWQTDLVIVGFHGKTGFQRRLLGSLSNAIALGARCSVAIVKTMDSH